MCACTCRRRSVIIFCADLESSCVRLKEVRPCTIVAPRTARTIGVNSPTCLCSTTLSTKYFMEPGSTNPETRLMAMSTKPNASSPRLGLTKAQTSGRFFHAFVRFSLLEGDLASFSVAMISEVDFTLAVRCRQQSKNYMSTIKTINRNGKPSSVASGSRARHTRAGRRIQIQDAGDEFADGDAEVAPEPALQAGIILRAAEEVAHQLPEHRAAPYELNHARGDRTPQKGAAIETPHDARRELEFGGESGLDPRGVLLRAALGERAPQQFAVKWIDPRSRISHQRPVLAHDVSFRKRSFLW